MEHNRIFIILIAVLCLVALVTNVIKEFKNNTRYFVIYYSYYNGDSFGSGNFYTETHDGKIFNLKDVTNALKEKNNFSQVVVTNFTELDKKSVEQLYK